LSTRLAWLASPCGKINNNWMRGTSIRATVLMLMLLASCLQCLARCADAGHQVPPCHRQQESKTPIACQTPVLLVRDAYTAPSPDPLAAVSEPVAMPIVHVVYGSGPRTFPPPAPPPPSLPAVLRV
jgi:hypothetical protein